MTINIIDMAHDALDAAKKVLKPYYDKPYHKTDALNVYITLYEAMTEDKDYKIALDGLRGLVKLDGAEVMVDYESYIESIERAEADDDWIKEWREKRADTILRNGMTRYTTTKTA